MAQQQSSVTQRAERTLVVWCPDWPVVATHVPLAQPIAVMHANRVVASSPNARREGVVAGLRRREAQARCPELHVVDFEPGRDAAAFEPIVSTIEQLAPRVEIVEPGICAVPTRGPSRYFGGDEALVQHLTMLVNETLRDLGLQGRANVGVADGTFAALLAARASIIVPEGTSRDFLAPQRIEVLERPPLVDLLRRLGIRTLGDFAALPLADVLGRFGDDGAVAHNLARGLDEQPFHARVAPLDLAVGVQLDPPVQRIDTAAFTAKSLAESLHQQLASHGLACNRLVIEADTESGETLRRIWRHDGQLSPSAIAERVRWQLDGWLNRTNQQRNQQRRATLADLEADHIDPEPTGGFVRLRLVPEGLLPDNGYQLGFWGGSIDADERTSRAFARVQGLLGEDGVVTAVVGGGRSPGDQVRFVPWGVAREPARPGSPLATATMATARTEAPSWPGRLPAPAPATVYEDLVPAKVFGADAVVVQVDGRGLPSSAPQTLQIDGGPLLAITAWAGPWLLDERWWDPQHRRRRARLQVQTEEGDAYLVILEQQQWWVEARYD